MILAELLIVLALAAAAAAGVYVGVRALARTLRGVAREHAEWHRSVTTEGGEIVYRVTRPGDDPQEVVRFSVRDDDLETLMLDAEVRADHLAEALNRGRRRA